ncbi:MAG: 16S rRNA (uracil(1498)-N(3))-methyltransferase [Ignavibacterium sp.]|nr:16S rRNA (uracil(1498)-N(3))-methyltransferase [Ignavibacterium sp.]MDW8376267.1 RsmE family RNA methyltransferase [Ignavibacteriales bacterium]
MEPLSNIELFYSEKISEKEILLVDEEFHHCANVFRKKINQEIFVTDGLGCIYRAKIIRIKNNVLTSEIIDKIFIETYNENLILCIPLLKNKERFRFAIEKSIEMGITKFIFFISERTVVNKFDDIKVKKIMIETIKQSLRSYLPRFKFLKSFKSLKEEIKENDSVFIFDLSGDKFFSKDELKTGINNYFIFGPEGGLSQNELELLSDEYKNVYKLSNHRLRTETAIVKLVSIIT